MLIIPALDILNGKLVRLEKGDYNSHKTYSENPIDTAKLFAENGFNLIHIVDLSGSKDGRINTIDLLRSIKSELKIEIQFGGGIRTLQDAQLLIENGVDIIIIGSISLSNKNEFEKIISTIGVEKVIAAIDSKDEMIKITGWTEETNITVEQHIQYCSSKSVKNFLCTDIEKDGMLTGPNIKLYKKLMLNFPELNIIASGGVSNIDDVKKLKSSGAAAVVIGKAIYENKINLKELAEIAG